MVVGRVVVCVCYGCLGVCYWIAVGEGLGFGRMRIWF